MNGKAAARHPLGQGVAARAAVSTGFRALEAGQQNTFNVATAFVDEELTNNGVVPSTPPVAVARGGRPLQPETSTNYSAGLVVEAGTMALTALLQRGCHSSATRQYCPVFIAEFRWSSGPRRPVDSLSDSLTS